MQPTNNHINYVEFKSTDLEATKTFYSNAFGWQFTDYGDSYVAFESSGLDGGFEKTSYVSWMQQVHYISIYLPFNVSVV